MRSGLPREEAFRRARIELGGVAVQKENIREAWGTRAWDELRSDLRYASRMLAKSPGFTAIAIGSLALGIGANTTIFTITKQILLDKLAVHNPDELRLFAWTSAKKSIAHHTWGYWDQTPDGKTICTSFSYPVYQQLRQQNHVLQDIFAFKNFPRLTATIDGKAEAVTAQLVSGNFYQALGVKPILGRGIQDADDTAPGNGPVTVISDALWSRRFGRSPDVIGKTIQLNLTPITIIGVNPPGFTGASSVQSSPDVFLPFSMAQIAAPKWAANKPMLTDANFWWVLVMGRVKPGIPDETARAALDVTLNAAVRSTMTVEKDRSLPSLTLQDGSRGENSAGRMFSKPVYVLMALAGFVLLLACANLANLLLARASSRQREMSVRLALGAGRSRILRQMFTESLLLSLSGGIAGLVLVLLYVLFYYRGLGLVVISGLLLTALMLWAIISSLGHTAVAPSFDLAGITGLIVSIGITVDSYIVYFERLKDETRSGRSIRTSVDRGFKSAWRTVWAADFVSLLAAIVLYLVAVGDVKGFAFFLGLSTIMDMAVTWFYTRPLVILLGQSPRLQGSGTFSIATGLGAGPQTPAPGEVVPAGAGAGGGGGS